MKKRKECPVCEGDPKLQPDCRDCAGSGMLRNVPFAQDPWNQLVLNLWLGGHDYSPPSLKGLDGWLGTEAPKITSEQFRTVISFYERPTSPQTVPSPDVRHHFYRMPDGDLKQEDLREVFRLSQIAVAEMNRPAPVLIRCQAGLNRSSLCAGYVLMQVGFDADQAIRLIRKNRSPYALCNTSFVDYLKAGLPDD